MLSNPNGITTSSARGATVLAAVLICLCGAAADARQNPAAPTVHADEAVGQSDAVSTEAQQHPPPSHPGAPALEAAAVSTPADYRIGPSDVLSIAVLQAPELNTSARVSERGDLSLPLLGAVSATGLTPQELEQTLEARLREKYIREPDVTVQLTDLQSQPVSVMGAVQRPGVFQMRGSHTLLEVLSLAGGLADDAGDTVVVLCKAGGRRSADGDPAQAHADVLQARAIGYAASPDPDLVEVKLRTLMDSPDSRVNLPIHPGDVVSVRSAPIVYVVGAIRKPGSFAMRGNERLTVLQALALGEGVTPTAAKGDAVLLRTEDGGERVEIPVDLNAILKGHDPDLTLEAQDVLFVPDSSSKIAVRATVDTLLRILTFRVIP